MSRETTKEKADRYLVEGRVKVVLADSGYAMFAVAGSEAGDPYFVKFVGDWLCDCPAQTVCCHILAAQKISALQPKGTKPVIPGMAELDQLLG